MKKDKMIKVEFIMYICNCHIEIIHIQSTIFSHNVISLFHNNIIQRWLPVPHGGLRVLRVGRLSGCGGGGGDSLSSSASSTSTDSEPPSDTLNRISGL